MEYNKKYDINKLTKSMQQQQHAQQQQNIIKTTQTSIPKTTATITSTATTTTVTTIVTATATTTTTAASSNSENNQIKSIQIPIYCGMKNSESIYNNNKNFSRTLLQQLQHIQHEQYDNNKKRDLIKILENINNKNSSKINNNNNIVNKTNNNINENCCNSISNNINNSKILNNSIINNQNIINNQFNIQNNNEYQIRNTVIQDTNSIQSSLLLLSKILPSNLLSKSFIQSLSSSIPFSLKSSTISENFSNPITTKTATTKTSHIPLNHFPLSLSSLLSLQQNLNYFNSLNGIPIQSKISTSSLSTSTSTASESFKYSATKTKSITTQTTTTSPNKTVSYLTDNSISSGGNSTFTSYNHLILPNNNENLQQNHHHNHQHQQNIEEQHHHQLQQQSQLKQHNENTFYMDTIIPIQSQCNNKLFEKDYHVVVVDENHHHHHHQHHPQHRQQNRLNVTNINESSENFENFSNTCGKLNIKENGKWKLQDKENDDNRNNRIKSCRNNNNSKINNNEIKNRNIKENNDEEFYYKTNESKSLKENRRNFVDFVYANVIKNTKNILNDLYICQNDYNENDKNDIDSLNDINNDGIHFNNNNNNNNNNDDLKFFIKDEKMNIDRNVKIIDDNYYIKQIQQQNQKQILHHEHLQSVYQQQQQQQQHHLQHQIMTRCCCSLTQKSNGEKTHYYHHHQPQEQQQQQHHHQNIEQEQQQQKQQEQQQQYLQQQQQEYYSVTREYNKDIIKKDINVKENLKRDFENIEEQQQQQQHGEYEKNVNVNVVVSKNTNGQENIILDKNVNVKSKKLSEDEEKDELFQIFQPWALKTYGDQAKTKTITLKKKTRILKALDGKEHSRPDSSKFRFWVKSKGFTTRKPEGFVDTQEQSKRIGTTDHIDLYVASTSKDFGERYYRKVAVVEEFFDIIYNVHVNLGGRSGRHAGQKRTYRIITETYGFLPREAVTKFLTTCPECKKNLRPYSPNTRVEDQTINDISVESTEALNYSSSHTESSKDSANLESKKLKSEEIEDIPISYHDVSRDIPPHSHIQSYTSQTINKPKSPIMQTVEFNIPKTVTHEIHRTLPEESSLKVNQKTDIKSPALSGYLVPPSSTSSPTESLAQKLKARKRSCESLPPEESSPTTTKESYEPFCKIPKTLEFHSDFYKNQENLFNYFQLLKKFYYRPQQIWQQPLHQDSSSNLNSPNIFPSPSIQQSFQQSDLNNFFQSMQQISNPLSYNPSSILYTGTSNPQHFQHTLNENEPNNKKSPNQSSAETPKIDLRTSPTQITPPQDKNNIKTKISPTSYSKQININIENAINLSTDSIDLTITPPNHHHHHHHNLGQTGTNNKDNTNLMVNSLDVSINVSNDSNQLKISCKTTPPSASPTTPTQTPSNANKINQNTTPTSHLRSDEKCFRDEKRTIYKPDSVDISPPFSVTSTCPNEPTMSFIPQQHSQTSDSIYYTTSLISPSILAGLTSVSNKNLKTSTTTAITTTTAATTSSTAKTYISNISKSIPHSYSYPSSSTSIPPILMTSDRQTCAINLSKKFHETKRYCDDGNPNGNPSQDNLKDCKIKNIEKSKAHNTNGKNEKDFISYEFQKENEDVLMMLNTIKNSSSTNNNNKNRISSSSSSSSTSSSSSSSAASSVVRISPAIKKEFSSYYGIDYKDIGMIMTGNNSNNNNGSNSSSTDCTIIQVPITSQSNPIPATSAAAYYQQHQQQQQQQQQQQHHVLPLKNLSLPIPSSSSTASILHSYKACDIFTGNGDGISSGGDGGGNQHSGNIYFSERKRKYEKNYYKKDNNSDEEDNNDIVAFTSTTTGTTTVSAVDINDDSSDNDDDDDDDIEYDNDIDDSNKNLNKIDLMKVKPITSTYLTLTRSMGLSDEDALKFDDLVSKDFKYSI